MDHYGWMQKQGRLFEKGMFDQIDPRFFELAVATHRERLFDCVLTVLQQFLMVDYYPDLNGWAAISESLHWARANALVMLADSPSLRPVLEAEYARIWTNTRNQVSVIFVRFDQDETVLPQENPYSLDTLLKTDALPKNWPSQYDR